MGKIECTAVVLAGGKSSRMGKNKALLPLFDKTNIENIVEKCKNVASEVIVVTNDFSQYQFLNLPLVEDTYKNSGPLAGLEAGLRAAKYERVVVVACDMPFVQSEIITILVESLATYDAVVPRINGELHPLFAAYRQSCLVPIQACLQENKRRIIAFYDDVKVNYITENDLLSDDPDIKRVFFNMNNPEEYEEAKKIEVGMKTFPQTKV